MQSRAVWCLMGTIVSALVLAASARAESNIVLPRPGQVGISVQGGYGGLMSSGSFGEEFSSGGSFAVRLRYRMRYERGLGLSFESQTFDAREASAVDTALTRLTLITSGFEFYQLFGTRTKTTRMLMVGAGITQARASVNNGDTFFFPGSDGMYVSAGAGLERFFFRSLAYDVSGRYYAVFKDSKVNHDFQAAVGLIFYASY